MGRDTEYMALSRAVRWHTENRILLHGRRTVVFPDANSVSSSSSATNSL